MFRFMRSPRSYRSGTTPALAGSWWRRDICPRCNHRNPPGSRYCNHCGQILHQGDTLADVTTIATPHNEERRIVTILFADLVDSTPLADMLDAEELRNILRAYFDRMSRHIKFHGGLVEKFIGDAIMGVFGLPRTHEDDPARAIRAALEMQQDLMAFNQERTESDPSAPQLHMRIGINTGEVVAATTSSDGSTFLVTGDAVNVAARLQQNARADAILVGPRTYRSTSTIVTYGAPEVITLKGKPAPLQVWTVQAMTDKNPVPLARIRSFEDTGTPFIGRAFEQNMIQATYDHVVADRRPYLVTIVGGPGIGKTRLAHEFIRAAQGRNQQTTVLYGRCALYGENIALWPVIEMMRRFYHIPPTMAAEDILQLLEREIAALFMAAGRSEDPQQIARELAFTIGIARLDDTGDERRTARERRQRQNRLARAWLTYCEALATRGPLIMHIDDIQWADTTLLQIIEAITRLPNQPIFVLCTARPEFEQKRTIWGGSRANTVAIDLEPLDDEESAALLEIMTEGSPLPGELRRNIIERTEGNPLFLSETTRMLIDRRILVRDEQGALQVDTHWRESEEALDPVIPDTVQGVLAARIDALPPEERDILCHAAIIGRTFWRGALMVLVDHTPRERVTRILATLVEKELLAPVQQGIMGDASNEPTYMFTHGMICDVAYDLIPRARRAHEHERFAVWLESFAEGRTAEFAEPLAHHYEEFYRQAGLGRSRHTERRDAIRQKIIQYLILAGDAARQRYATTTAVAHYSHALSIVRESTDPSYDLQIALFTKRGDTYALDTDGDQAWTDYQAALTAWQAQEKRTPDQQRVGLQIYRRLVMVPARNASWFRTSPDPAVLHQYLEAGIQLAEDLGEHDSLDRAALLTAKTFFWWSWAEGRDLEQIQDALASAEEAVDIAERLRAPRQASEALDALGNMQAATTNLVGHLRSQVRRLYWAKLIDDPLEVTDIHCEVSSAHQMVGEYPRAVEAASTALTIADQTDIDLLRAWAHQRLTIAYYEWDRWQDVQTHGETLIALGGETSFSSQNHYRWGALAYAAILARTGQQERVDDVLRHLESLPPRPESQYLYVFRARVEAALGHLDRAERILRSGLNVTAGRHIFPALLADLAELGARLTRRELTINFGERAVDLGKRSGARKPLAVAIRARGVAAMGEEDLEGARRDLHDALERFIDLGAHWEEGRTRYVLAGLYRKQRDEDAAQIELQRASHLFEQLGAVRDIARVRGARSGTKIQLP